MYIKRLNRSVKYLSHKTVYIVILTILSLGQYIGCHSQSSEKTDPKINSSITYKQKFVRTLSQSNDPNKTSPGILTLKDAIAEALATSPELEQMERRIDAAAQQLVQAEAAYYPRLLLSQDFHGTDNPVYAMMHIINQQRLNPRTNFNDPGWQHNYSTQFRSEMLLLDAGGRFANRQAAEYQRESYAAQWRTARNQLVGAVTQTYYRWLQARQFTQVAKLAWEQSQTNERLGQSRVDAEAALQSELLRLKTRTAEAKANLVSARISTRRLQAALERLLVREIKPSEIPAGEPQ